MLKIKKEFENTVIEYKIGTVKVKIKVCDITQNHIDLAKAHQVDLSYFFEEEKERKGCEPLKPIEEEAPIKKTRKRRKNG
jgi:hypothetical protein